jgi:drug/metabolite transporter (DMT)-like permease
MKRHLLRAFLLALLILLLVPALALAAGTVLTPVPQVWVLLLGALTPLITYVLNHYAPWVTEPIKATVLAVVAGIIGAIYTALETSIFGFNNATLQLVGSAIVAAFAAHLLIWRPSGIAEKLGGGSNAPAKGPAK